MLYSQNSSGSVVLERSKIITAFRIKKKVARWSLSERHYFSSLFKGVNVAALPFDPDGKIRPY